MALLGIDTSNNNVGVPDATIKADFIIFKATEGIGFVDSDCDPSYQEAKAAGKLLGVYHFARPDGNDAVAEADFFVNAVRGYVGEAVLVLDWEHQPTNDVFWAKRWLDRVYELTGVRALIYMNTSTANAFDWSPIWHTYALWVAQYRDYAVRRDYDMNGLTDPDVKWPNAYAMWQFTSSGRLNGYAGNLDCNIFYGTADGWRRFAQGDRSVPAPAPQPAPQPEPKPAPAPEPQPEPAPQPAPEPQPAPQPTPAPEPAPVVCENRLLVLVQSLIKLISGIFRV